MSGDDSDGRQYVTVGTVVRVNGTARIGGCRAL